MINFFPVDGKIRNINENLSQVSQVPTKQIALQRDFPCNIPSFIGYPFLNAHFWLSQYLFGQ